MQSVEAMRNWQANPYARTTRPRLISTSGLTRNLPTMILLSALYCTPEDAAAEINFVKHSGHSNSYVKVGEPDGQR